MLQKDLNSTFTAPLQEHEPSLSNHYKVAHGKVIGRTVTVAKKDWPKFAKLEAELRKHGVSSLIYARTVMPILKDWCKRNNMRQVPVSVFLGNWAQQRFYAIYESESVQVITDEVARSEELLQAELMVARLYIEGGGTVRMSQIVKDIEPLLSPIWLELYNAKSPKRYSLISEVVERLEQETGIHANNYTDFIVSC